VHGTFLAMIASNEGFSIGCASDADPGELAIMGLAPHPTISPGDPPSYFSQS
jgi:hypothetical protein